MRQLTLAERAATTKPMSAEQVAMCDEVAAHGEQQGRIIRNLCASHEALRAELQRQQTATVAKYSRLLEFAERLDASNKYEIAEELFAILRG